MGCIMRFTVATTVKGPCAKIMAIAVIIVKLHFKTVEKTYLTSL